MHEARANGQLQGKVTNKGEGKKGLGRDKDRELRWTWDEGQQTMEYGPGTWDQDQGQGTRDKGKGSRVREDYSLKNSEHAD